MNQIGVISELKNEQEANSPQVSSMCDVVYASAHAICQGARVSESNMLPPCSGSAHFQTRTKLAQGSRAH
jgi:hypothetical protein